MVGIGRFPAEVGPVRGDVHFVVFPDLGGHVMKGPRPGLVIQTGRMSHSSTTVVLPMTTSARAAEFDPPFLVSAASRETGLPRDGWVKCDQPLTLPTSLLGPRVGRFSPEALGRVEAALRFVLEL